MAKSELAIIKTRFPASIRDALKTADGSKTMVKRLYEENASLKLSLAAVQDELENWRSKYYESDKRVSVLDERISSSIAAEIIKFLVSTILAGIGINLATGGAYVVGSIFIIGSIVSYILIVILGKKK